MTDLENLDAYRARTRFMWDSLPSHGDTVLFPLDESTIGREATEIRLDFDRLNHVTFDSMNNYVII